MTSYVERIGAARMMKALVAVKEKMNAAYSNEIYWFLGTHRGSYG